RLTVSCENTPFLWFTSTPSRLLALASCRQHAALDPHRADHYRSAPSPDRRNRRRAARGTAPDRWAFDDKGFDHGTAMRTDRKDTPDRPSGQPFEPQDQAAVFAQPAQCYADLRRAWPFGPPADFGQCAEIGRSPRRSRRFPPGRQGYRAVATGV